MENDKLSKMFTIRLTEEQFAALKEMFPKRYERADAMRAVVDALIRKAKQHAKG